MCGRTAASRSRAALLRLTGARGMARRLGGAAGGAPSASSSFAVAASAPHVPAPFYPGNNIGPMRRCPVLRVESSASEESDDEPAIDAKVDIDAADAPDIDAADAPAPDDEPSPPGRADHKQSDNVTKSDQLDLAVLDVMRWGLVPSISETEKSFKGTLINARSETIASKSMFSRLVNRRRCIVPIDGFFEWHNTTDKAGRAVKHPYFVHKPDKQIMYVAGLWDCWDPAVAKKRIAMKEASQNKSKNKKGISSSRGPDGDSGDSKSAESESQSESSDRDVLYTYTVLTTSPSKELGWLHDRMPVILDADEARRWLDVKNHSYVHCWDLMRPYPRKLEWYRVSDKVNKIGNDGPDILLKAEDAKKKSFAKGLGRFFQPLKGNKKKEVPEITLTMSSRSGTKRKATTTPAPVAGRDAATDMAADISTVSSPHKRAKTETVASIDLT
jgi:putative SOS response-associated peptidase YedK